MPKLTLIVLRCSKLERSNAFYQQLGLAFVPEKHGSGPEHWSSTIGKLVLELYPASQKSPVTTGVRLGFAVDNVESTLTRLLESGATIVTPLSDSPSGRRAVVADPDGNRIKILTPAMQ